MSSSYYDDLFNEYILTYKGKPQQMPSDLKKQLAELGVDIIAESGKLPLVIAKIPNNLETIHSLDDVVSVEVFNVWPPFKSVQKKLAVAEAIKGFIAVGSGNLESAATHEYDTLEQCAERAASPVGKSEIFIAFHAYLQIKRMRELDKYTNFYSRSF